jgi:hypothetical protein
MDIHEAIELINNEDLVFDKGVWKAKLPYFLKTVMENAILYLSTE